MSIDPEFSPGHYFANFNMLFINPKNDIRPGLRKGIELAEQQKNTRQLAAACYFSGFTKTLYGEYDAAMLDLKRSLKLNPGYGSAHLALIAAASLSKRADTFRAARSFMEKHPDFDRSILNYMWLDALVPKDTGNFFPLCWAPSKRECKGIDDAFYPLASSESGSSRIGLKTRQKTNSATRSGDRPSTASVQNCSRKASRSSFSVIRGAS